MVENLKDANYSDIDLEEKPNKKKWVVFGILVLAAIIAFLVFSNPKSLGLAGLPELNFESTIEGNESQGSNELLEAIAKPFEIAFEGIANALGSLNPFNSESKESKFENIRLNAVLQTDSFQVELKNALLECRNGLQVKEKGKETKIISGTATINGFEGIAMQNSGLLVLNGFVQDINARNVQISFTEKEGIQAIAEECKTETMLEEFTAAVTGTIETESTAIKLENSTIKLENFKGEIAFKENGIEFKGSAGLLEASSIEENVRIE